MGNLRGIMVMYDVKYEIWYSFSKVYTFIYGTIFFQFYGINCVLGGAKTLKVNVAHTSKLISHFV